VLKLCSSSIDIIVQTHKHIFSVSMIHRINSEFI